MAAPSPLAPDSFPTLPPIDGVRLAAGECGIRYANRKDVLIVELAAGTTVAGVFTKSLTASAPVLSCKANAAHGNARVLVVNSGNSNAFTGKSGEASLARVQKAACDVFGAKSGEFFMASTGVIGEKLPDEKITAALGALKASLNADAWNDAARAIMTTDTFPKMATRSAVIGGMTVTINGIAKGSGMIAPDMATMLAFIFTDAAIPATILQQMLASANAKSFNCITVDGDTSTSDTALFFATGKAGNQPPKSISDTELSEFCKAFDSLMLELAHAIIRDGEGAQKFVSITVKGAENDRAARTIGMSIANSPLVKTALAAGDANWGRIVAAIGKAGEKADRDKLAITIGGVSVAKNGEADPTYIETAIDAHMKGQSIDIAVDVGVGSGTCTVWTCDLTHGYIDINGSYRS